MTAVQQQAGAGVVAATRHPHSFGSFVKDWFTGGSRTQAVVPALEAFLSAQETYEDRMKAAAGDEDGLDGKSEAERKYAAGLELEVATGAMLRAVMSAETLMVQQRLAVFSVAAERPLTRCDVQSFGVCSDFETNVGTLPVPAVDAELNRVVVFTSQVLCGSKSCGLQWADRDLASTPDHQTAVEVSLRARSVGADSSMRHEPQLLFYGCGCAHTAHAYNLARLADTMTLSARSIHSKYCQHGDSADGGVDTAPEFHVCVDPESRHETHLDRHDVQATTPSCPVTRHTRRNSCSTPPTQIFSLISLADAFALESAMRLAVTKPADSAAALAAVAPFNIHLLLNKEEGPSEGTTSYSPVMIDIDAGTEATADSSGMERGGGLTQAGFATGGLTACVGHVAGALALPVFTAKDKVARFQLNNLRSNHVVPSTVTDLHAAGKVATQPSTAHVH